LVDPESGRTLTNQIILVQDGRFTQIGPNLQVPAGAQVIDLSDLTVLPGLVDAHNHLALTYEEDPENNIYYLTYVMDSTPLRVRERREQQREQDHQGGRNPRGAYGSLLIGSGVWLDVAVSGRS